MQAKMLIPILLAFALASYFLYLYSEESTSENPSSGCAGLNASKINSLIESFMENEGFLEYSIEEIGPVHCSYGVSTYNVKSGVIVRPGEPQQSVRNMRLQIRSDVNGTRIYEVLLSNPSRDSFR